jgi:X-X-X-Leu-X-X-Gly heptad repeat protein
VRRPCLHRARRATPWPSRARVSALALAVLALLASTPPAPVPPGAACADPGAEPVATAVTVRLADDGEVLAAEVTDRAGAQRCAIEVPAAAASDVAPVAVAIVHEAADGRSLEGSALRHETDPITTMVAVRDATATTRTITVTGPEGREDVTVRMGTPQLVTVTLTYPPSWQVTAPTGDGTAAQLSGAGVEVVHRGILFPPLTGEELRFEVVAAPGRGTPSLEVEVTPIDGEQPLLPVGGLDRDAAAVLGALSVLAADGAEDLADGTGQLADGAGQLADGSGELAAGAGELADGTGDLAGGLDQLAAGTSQLSDGLGASAAGARELAAGSRQLADGTGQLAGGFPELAAGARAIADGTAELAGQLDLAATGAGELADGGATLAEGAQQLADGTAELATLATAMRDRIVADLPALPLDPTIPDLPPGLLDELLADLPEDVRREVEAQLLAAVARLEAELAATIGPVVESTVEEAVAQLDELLGLADRFTELADGAAAVAEGTAAIAAGNAELADGLRRAADGTSELADGADGVAGGLDEVQTGLQALATASDQLADGMAAFAAGSGDLAGAGAQLTAGAREAAGGASLLADGTGELADGAAALADGTGELADGAEQLAAGAAELPGGLRELTGTADRAGQRTATTEAILTEGLELARAASGDADSLTTVLTHAGSDPLPASVWALIVLGVGLAGAGGWFAYRRHSLAREAVA